MSGKRPALEALSAAEKAAVLDELLAARPDLREPAEAHAAQLMTDADRVAVADDVESALQGRDIEELNTRAGHRPGRGYVHPAEAADEILDEALQPFLDDLRRRAGLGMRSATAELAAGILLGLYKLPPRHLRDAAGVRPGLRGRARVRCGARLREARHRATRRRAP